MTIGIYMTYFGFLLCFLILPILIFLFLNWRNFNKPFWLAVLLHVFLAVAYTTPWDNYLVATHVWFYNPQLVTGILFGYVPLEEYTFFVLQTILAGLWWRFLSERFSTPQNFKPSKPARLIAFFVTLIVWIFFTALFFNGEKYVAYLSITLFWALPAVLPQLLFGADILWHHRKLVALAILIPALYLSLTDIVALKATTWLISPTQTTGILFFGILPLEEVVFFLVTNILIAFGMTLLLSNESKQRLSDWKSEHYKGLP